MSHKPINLICFRTMVGIIKQHKFHRTAQLRGKLYVNHRLDHFIDQNENK